MIEEILPGVCRWSAFSPAHRVELTAHAVGSDDGLRIFDPIVPPSEVALPRSSRDRVLLTNENHERAAAAWLAEGVPVWCSPEAGTTLPGIQRWGAGADPDPAPGWTRIPLAGGPPGETAFLLPKRSLMIFGDAVVNLPGRGLEILPDKYCRDPRLLRESLRGLPDFDHAMFAHGEPLLAAAGRRVASLL